jgi:hypothetical protein
MNAFFTPKISKTRTFPCKMSSYSAYTDEIKTLVLKSDMILVVPLSTVRVEYIQGKCYVYVSVYVNMNKCIHMYIYIYV